MQCHVHMQLHGNMSKSWHGNMSKSWHGNMSKSWHGNMCLSYVRRRMESFCSWGVLVCQRAFQILTGVPAGTIQQAREAMRANAVTALTRKELGMWASIRNAAMAPRYLDARAWIEVHAEMYAEANPMTGQMVLPFGRKSDYYHMYCWERSQEVLHHLDGKWAAQNTFLQAWRCEP